MYVFQIFICVVWQFMLELESVPLCFMRDLLHALFVIITNGKNRLRGLIWDSFSPQKSIIA